MRVRSLLAIAFSLILTAGQGRAAPLRAGAAQAVITPHLNPQQPLYLAGFGHGRTASGVHDDLYARCLALAAGGRPVVLCVVDLIGLFHADVETIRSRFARIAPGGGFLIVAATHTHAGPDTLGLYGPRPLVSGADPAYMLWTEDRVASTAAAAVSAMQPATLTLGREDNPLLGLLQGVDRPPVVKDPYVFAMRLRSRATGRTIATLVNFADHPETLGRKNTQITSDYPHWVRKALEKRYGGIALFFSGALGKVSPLGNVYLPDPNSGRPAPDGSWLKAELLGNAVGQQAIRALSRGDRAQIDTISIRSASVEVPLANPLFRAAIAAGVFAGRRPLYTRGRLDARRGVCEVPQAGDLPCATGAAIRTEVDAIDLHGAAKTVAEFVTLPGEAYPEMVDGGVAHLPGADDPNAPIPAPLRPQMKALYQFVLGLGDDEIGYLIPRAEWDQQPPWLDNAPHPWYGEINSVGPDAAGAVVRALERVMQQRSSPVHKSGR